MSAQYFTYAVSAVVETFGGSTRSWHGEATIGIRADSSQGYNALRAAVRVQAEAAMRVKGLAPSGRLDLKTWEPTASSR